MAAACPTGVLIDLSPTTLSSSQINPDSQLLEIVDTTSPTAISNSRPLLDVTVPFKDIPTSPSLLESNANNKQTASSNQLRSSSQERIQPKEFEGWLEDEVFDFDVTPSHQSLGVLSCQRSPAFMASRRAFNMHLTSEEFEEIHIQAMLVVEDINRMYQEQSESNVTVLSPSNCTEIRPILRCSQNSNILASKLSANDNPKVTDIRPTVYINPSPLLTDALSGSKDNKENCPMMKTVVKLSSKNVKIEEIQKTFAIPCSASLILNNLGSPDCVLAEVISGNTARKEEEEVISTSPACKLINLDYDGLENCVKEDMNEESCEKPRSCGDDSFLHHSVTGLFNATKNLLNQTFDADAGLQMGLNRTFDKQEESAMGKPNGKCATKENVDSSLGVLDVQNAIFSLNDTFEVNEKDGMNPFQTADCNRDLTLVFPNQMKDVEKEMTVQNLNTTFRKNSTPVIKSAVLETLNATFDKDDHFPADQNDSDTYCKTLASQTSHSQMLSRAFGETRTIHAASNNKPFEGRKDEVISHCNEAKVQQAECLDVTAILAREGVLNRTFEATDAIDSGNAEDNTVSRSSDTPKKLIDASGMAVLGTSRVLNKTFDGNDAPLAASTKTDVRQCEKTEKDKTGLTLAYEGAQLLMSSNKKELLQVHHQNDKDKGAKNIVQKVYPAQPVNMTHGEDSPFIVTEGPNSKDDNIEEVFCSTFVSSQVDNSEQCSNDTTTSAEDGSLPVTIQVTEKKEVRPTRATGAIPKSCGMKKKLLPPRLGPSQASKLGNKTVNLKNSKAVDVTVMISSNASGAPKKQSVVDKTLQNKGRAIPKPSGLKPNSTKSKLSPRQSEVNTTFLAPMERARLPLHKNNSTFKRPLSENDTKTVPKKTSRLPVLPKRPPPSAPTLTMSRRAIRSPSFSSIELSSPCHTSTPAKPRLRTSSLSGTSEVGSIPAKAFRRIP